MIKSSLSRTSLSDLCVQVTDGTHDTPPTISEGYPLIKAKEITGGVIDFDNCDYIDKSEHLKVIARSKPEKGDILFAHIGASLGETAYIKTDRSFSIKNVALFKPNSEKVNGRYLYYCVISPSFQNGIKNHRTGSAQPFVGLAQLREFELMYHEDLTVQKRIAAILSAYDDLIENNTRRIKILEEMAQRIYRQWFVDFKFPGHEKVKFVDSAMGKIPQGWEVGRLGDISEVIPGFAFKSKDWVTEGIPVIKIKNIKGNNTIETDDADCVPFESYNNMSKYCLETGDVLVAMTGAKAGKAGRLRTNKQMLLNQRVAKIKSVKGFESYAWSLISQQDVQDKFYKLADGAAQPNMSGGQLENFQTLIPAEKVLSEFDNIANSIYHNMDYLYFAIANLRRTRDLLLPKLINGEIEV